MINAVASAAEIPLNEAAMRIALDLDSRLQLLVYAAFVELIIPTLTERAA